MKPELRARIIAFNKAAAKRKDKADDLDIIVAAFAKLPPGQLKKVLTDDVIAVLEKHGLEMD
jgi:aspartate 1-decarboxylase